jgi:hypothetical protein
MMILRVVQRYSPSAAPLIELATAKQSSILWDAAAKITPLPTLPPIIRQSAQSLGTAMREGKEG